MYLCTVYLSPPCFYVPPVPLRSAPPDAGTTPRLARVPFAVPSLRVLALLLALLLCHHPVPRPCTSTPRAALRRLARNPSRFPDLPMRASTARAGLRPRRSAVNTLCPAAHCPPLHPAASPSPARLIAATAAFRCCRAVDFTHTTPPTTPTAPYPYLPAWARTLHNLPHLS